MTSQKKINGKNIEDYKDSYTLKYLLESTFSEFYKMDFNQRLELYKRLDKEVSEKFLMPRANLICCSNEYTLDVENIFWGDFEKVGSPLEFICRYFFEKRQQYQRICVANDHHGSFSEEEFNYIKHMFEPYPVSKRQPYVPYSKGLKEYLTNYNKVDALIFAIDQCSACIDIIDFKRVAASVSFIEIMKLSSSMKRLKKNIDKICDSIDDSSFMGVILRENEYLFLENLKYFIENSKLEIEEKFPVLLCFHENVWNNLDEKQKKRAVIMCNDLLSEIMYSIYPKNISFKDGRNSYEFADSNEIYVGNVMCGLPSSVLRKIVYDYAYNYNYGQIRFMSKEKRHVALKEIEECKSLFEKGDVDRIRKYRFVKQVDRTAKWMMNNLYKYISNNLIINGKEIKMGIKKEFFIGDIYDMKRRRGR